jgi:hypothetical protein
LNIEIFLNSIGMTDVAVRRSKAPDLLPINAPEFG